MSDDPILTAGTEAVDQIHGQWGRSKDADGLLVSAVIAATRDLIRAERDTEILAIIDEATPPRHRARWNELLDAKRGALLDLRGRIEGEAR